MQSATKKDSINIDDENFVLISRARLKNIYRLHRRFLRVSISLLNGPSHKSFLQLNNFRQIIHSIVRSRSKTISVKLHSKRMNNLFTFWNLFAKLRAREHGKYKKRKKRSINSNSISIFSCGRDFLHYFHIAQVLRRQRLKLKLRSEDFSNLPARLMGIFLNLNGICIIYVCNRKRLFDRKRMNVCDRNSSIQEDFLNFEVKERRRKKKSSSIDFSQNIFNVFYH